MDGEEAGKLKSMDGEEAQVGAGDGRTKRRRIMEVGEDTFKAKLAAASKELGREVRVFVSAATIMSSDSSSSGGSKPSSEEPDDFYEFTTEDYYRLLANKKEDKFLKTKKFRDAEEAARRARITKAIIRVQFPDNYIIEAKFQPSETISTLVDFLKKVLALPEMPFYIYTTPPKQRIKDLTKDFYSAGLVPGANVHFSYDIPKGEENETINNGPFLSDHIMALCDLHLFAMQIMEKPSSPKSLAVEPPPEPSNQTPAVKKTVKPKWLKM